MHPNGASKNNDDQAVFSKAGPNLSSPDVTKMPKVVPNMYKLRKSNNNAGPIFKIDTPNNGLISIIAGIIPINVLSKAVVVNAVITSLIFNGATNKFTKFLLQISSRNNILKLILDRNKKS